MYLSIKKIISVLHLTIFFLVPIHIYFIFQFKLEIVKMNSKLWKLVGTHQAQNGPLLLDYDQMLTKNFIFTFNYVFDMIEVTTKKFDMVKCINNFIILLVY